MVEREENLDALSVLFVRPNGLVLESFLKEAERIGGFAEENCVLVMGWGLWMATPLYSFAGSRRLCMRLLKSRLLGVDLF